jgi:hypothetical protein
MIVEGTATVVSQIVDVLVLPFGRTHHTLQLVWLSILSGFGMAYVFKLTSSQKAIRRAKDRIKARVLEMRLYQDDPVLIFSGLAGALTNNLRYLGTIFVPFLIIIVPIAVVFMQLDQRYSKSNFEPNSLALLTVDLKIGFDPFQTMIDVRTGDGVTIQGKPARDASTRSSAWELLIDRAGTHEVTLYAKGTSYAFPIVAEPSYRMIGSERRSSSLLEPLLHPGLPPLPAASPFQRIHIEYPSASHWLLGMEVHWIVIFLVYSLLSAALLKFLIGIEI